MDIPNFEFIKLLGSGSFGHVFEVIQKSDHKKYALKRIMKVGNIISREYQILEMLSNCDHIIKIKVNESLYLRIYFILDKIQKLFKTS